VTRAVASPYNLYKEGQPADREPAREGACCSPVPACMRFHEGLVTASPKNEFRRPFLAFWLGRTYMGLASKESSTSCKSQSSYHPAPTEP
jgi:hypothetical protein